MRCVIVILLAAAWTTGPVLGQVPEANELEGRPLRYLIGADAAGPGRDEAVTVVSYSATHPAMHGISVAYGNLFDEQNTGRYGPYLHKSDTAAQYNEGEIDPQGPGWDKNLREQFERQRKQGFAYIELDNADAYTVRDVLGAVELAARYDLQVFAKIRASVGRKIALRTGTSVGSSWNKGRAAQTIWIGCDVKQASPHFRFGSWPSARDAHGRRVSRVSQKTIAIWA